MAIDIQVDKNPTPNPLLSVTRRAILTGLFLVLVIDLLGICVRYIFHGSQMTYSHIPMAMLIGLVVFLVVGAILARTFQWHLSPSEWHCIFIMGLVGATVPGFGLSGYLIGYLAAPYYFATEENNWEKFLHPHMPSSLIPSGDGQAISHFLKAFRKGHLFPGTFGFCP